MDKEALNFHCINLALNSNYEALKKIRSENSSWTEAWEKQKNSHKDIIPEKESEKLGKLGIGIITMGDSAYPALLREISWPPLGLYIKGSLPNYLAEKPAIAIVGTRKATENGKGIAQKIARGLARQNLTVISGLAMGIDESAHWGAVEENSPNIAVLATGLDKIYPAQNENLARRILECNGCLISEYPPGTTSYPSNFVHRNRIVSGISIATVAIEAPEKSGSLITAKFALEQNREVFIVPGPAGHINYLGSHRLIRDGARLVTSAEEILEDLGMTTSAETSGINSAALADMTDEEKAILTAIEKIGWPAPIDKISQISKIGVQKVNQIIAFLTVKGIIK